MLRNYIITALRNLVRNRLYAAINIVGLAVGFAAAIFAALFVRNETTYEQWIPDHDNIYTIATYARSYGSTAIEYDGAMGGAAEWLKLDFSEVAAAARLIEQEDMVVQHGSVRAIEPRGTICTADADFFTVVPLTPIAGNLASALAEPDGVVLTRRMARKYFGTDAPIGGILEFDQHPMRVTAVIEDWPANTAFRGGAFVSGRAPFSFIRTLIVNLDRGVIPTYVRLKSRKDLEAVQAGMPGFVRRHMEPDLQSDARMRLRPIASLHLDPLIALDRASRLAVIYGVGGIGLLIVLSAAINFVTITTARAARRAVEVGVRKVSGARRRQLIVQFVGESMLYAVFGMALAVGVVELLLPVFQTLVDRAVPFDIWSNDTLIGGLIVLACTIGVLAGAYPAFILSAFLPAAVLKAGTIQSEGSGILRRLLVLTQFAVLIGLGVAVATVYRQTDFALNESTRFNTDAALTIERACTAAMRNEVRALPGVREVACANGVGGDYRGQFSDGVVGPDGTRYSGFGIAPIDPEFFSVYGVSPLAGRLFDKNRGEDIATTNASVNPNIIINETAARRLGFASPQAAIGQVISWRRTSLEDRPTRRQPRETAVPSRIIGVVADISFYESVDRPTIAKIYFADPMYWLPQGGISLTGTLNVKLTGQDVPETLQAIDKLWARLGDPNWPIQRHFLDEQLQQQFRYITRQAQLADVFAAVALFLAGLGLFALSAYTAEHRTKEIGVRKAMGASRADILRLLLWEFTKPVLLANIIAWPLAYYAMNRWLSSYVHHIDLAPWMFWSASALALVIALVTVSGHVALIARAQPVTALRYE